MLPPYSTRKTGGIMKRISFAMLAVVAGLYGCATTETQDSSSSSSATPSGSQSSGPRTGAAQPPVKMGQGGMASSSSGGAQMPDLKRSVYFEFDKYDIKPEYRSLLETHARWLRANPKARLTIEGNADERGSREYNVALGQRRAEAVMKQLVVLGAKPEQIEAVSWGEEKPRRSGQDEASWAENRRDDFVAK
jgi:peptidoglycan-associated lipoprotein